MALRIAAVKPAERYGALITAIATVLASLGVAGRLGLTVDDLAQLGTALVGAAVLMRAAWQAWRAESTPLGKASVALDSASEVLASTEIRRAVEVLERATGKSLPPDLRPDRVLTLIEQLQRVVVQVRPIVDRNLRPVAGPAEPVPPPWEDATPVEKEPGA